MKKIPSLYLCTNITLHRIINKKITQTSTTQHKLIGIDDNRSKCDEEGEDDGDGDNADNNVSRKHSFNCYFG